MYIMLVVVIFIGLCGLEYLMMKNNKKVLGIILPLLGFGVSQYFILPNILGAYFLYRARTLANLDAVSLSGPAGYLLIICALVIIPTIVFLLIYIKGLRKSL